MSWFDLPEMSSDRPSWLTSDRPFMTQGGSASDPRWTDGTWGSGEQRFQMEGSDINPDGAAMDPFAYTKGSLLTPWTRTFSAPPGSGGGYAAPEMDPFQYGDFSYSFRDPGQFNAGPAFSAPGPFKYDAYTPATPFKHDAYTAPDKFSFQDFVAPEKFAGISDADLRADPSYQFRFDQGQRALENNMAARGVMRGGAGAKALLEYGQNAASQEYGNVYARKASEAARNFDQTFAGYQARRTNAAENFDRNEANRLGAYRTNYDVASGTYDRNEANRLGAYRTNYDVASGTYDRNFRTAFDTHNANFANALNAYRANAETALGAGSLGFQVASGAYDRNRMNARQRWEDAYSLASQRASAGAANANQAYSRARGEYEDERDQFYTNQDRQWSKLVTLAGMGDPGGYAANMGNMITGRGNAAAAGTMGSANAWANGLNQVGNAAMDWGTMYALNRRRSPSGGGNPYGIYN